MCKKPLLVLLVVLGLATAVLGQSGNPPSRGGAGIADAIGVLLMTVVFLGGVAWVVWYVWTEWISVFFYAYGGQMDADDRKREETLRKRGVCPACEGSGETTIVCGCGIPNTHGKMVYGVTWRYGGIQSERIYEPCQSCDGSGQVPKLCESCSGTGKYASGE